MQTINIGVAGDEGSFSEQAAELYAKQKMICPNFSYLIDMQGVLQAIEQGNIELGVLPIINRQGGLVKPALEAMGQYAFQFMDELWMHIEQCLLVLPETSPQQVQQIVSHPQGLAQCRRYLQKEFPGIEQQEWCDTAKAARDLARGVLAKNTAVIAAEPAAKHYGLEILAKNIQDRRSNLTAFIIVKNRADTRRNLW